MSDEDRPDDPYAAILAALGLPPVRDWPPPYHGPDRRQQDRRQQDRREAVGKSRRERDRETALLAREFLLEYLQQLPAETFWRWFDGLVLGLATHRQLAILIDVVVRREAEHRDRHASPSRRGRPTTNRIHPLLDPVYNASLAATWRLLTQEFKDFSKHRQDYHATRNRTRRAHKRDECLRSAIGRRTDAAGLFKTLLEDRRMTPRAMAARLMHRELERRLDQRETRARERAEHTLSPPGKEFELIVAAKAADDRRLRLGTWRTLLDLLQRWSSR